jgi:hypothetical protein
MLCSVLSNDLLEAKAQPAPLGIATENLTYQNKPSYIGQGYREA